MRKCKAVIVVVKIDQNSKKSKSMLPWEEKVKQEKFYDLTRCTVST